MRIHNKQRLRKKMSVSSGNRKTSKEMIKHKKSAIKQSQNGIVLLLCEPNKTPDVRIMPMMPKRFTAIQRKELRQYEKTLYTGKDLNWDF